MLKNKIIYLCLLAYGIAFAILYDQYISMLILIVLFCIPVVLLAILLLTVPFVTIEMPEQLGIVNKNDPFLVALLLKNRSKFPITHGKIKLSYYNQFANEETKEKITVFVDGSSEQTVNCSLASDYCGNIIVNCEFIRIYDYFRIFSIKKKIGKQIRVSVLPELREMEVEIIRDSTGELVESNVYSKSKAGDDPSEVFDIREYREGDKIHRIHWKLSSKKDHYMVKEFSLPITCSAVILLDLYYDGNKSDVYSYMDKLIETASSLSYTFVLNEYMHYAAWYDVKSQEIKRLRIDSEDDLYLLIEELLLVNSFREKDLFSRAYCALFEGEQLPNMYYVGGGDTAYFESYSLRPEVVETYEE